MGVIGAKDYIDQLLVQKYGDIKANNHDNIASIVSPDEMYRNMDEYANVKRQMLALSYKLNTVCQKLTIKSAYKDLDRLKRAKAQAQAC
jgi:hypothetical protein